MLVRLSIIAVMVAVSSPIFAIEQNLEMIKVGEDKFLHWYGHTGRTYFVQVSDPNDLLRTWIWCPVIETGNDEEIWHLCGGTADKGFFRLKYTDQPTTDPENDDFDGDSLSNLHEISYYNSDPLDSDTDNDGMPDEFEAIYFFDLNFDEGGYDYDGDGLTNLGEFIAGTEPYYSDTDGDGMNDGFEVTHSLDPLNAADATDDEDSDGLNNLWEFKLGLNPHLTDSNNNGVIDPLEDRDQDGLTNISELSTHLTLPAQPDTDDDGLSDGWELLYGYSALVNNETDADLTNDPDDDPDNDGLVNTDEDQIGTNPNNEDTDGDGFWDAVEDQSASSATILASTPANPGGTPGGPAAPPPPTIPVEVTFGDHSSSHSEKYKVLLEPLEGDAYPGKRWRTNNKYGQAQSRTFHLPAGAKYKITIIHVGTDPEYYGDPKPDYDYTLIFTSNSTDTAIKAIPEDTSGMLGVHDEGEEFFAADKDATLYVAWMTSETVAQVPADRKRVKLGVGEEVLMKVRPAMEDATWTATLGSFTEDSGSESLLRLTDSVGDLRAEVLYLGNTLTKNFTVFAPTGIASASIASTIDYPVGQASAGMHLFPVIVAPVDVSFYNVRIMEVGENASNVTGYFLDHPRLHHTIVEGADRWLALDQANRWSDEANLEDWPAPWDKTGSFTWNIPAKWKVVGFDFVTGEHVMTGWNQVFSIQVGGTITIQKFGRSVTRTTQNVITTN